MQLLRALVAEVQGLRADLRDHGSRRTATPALSRADRARLARMLPAIAGVYGPDTFSSRDLAEDTAAAVRLVVRGLSVKQIGKLCARANGIPIHGLMVRKQDKECQVTLWQIVAC